MKSKLTAYVALTLAVAGASAADYTDTAQVISATPILERVTEPRQECTTETAAAPQPKERSVAAPILGGVTGAVIGSQVGGGSGRDVATATGAVAGTVIGDRAANPDSNRSYTGTIIGGIAGAILGNQVGQGRGNAAATAAGAIAGSMIGDRVNNRQTAAAQPVQRCRTVETTREFVKGYSVVYRYRDQDITTVLPHNPGKTVKVGISVIDSGTDSAAGATPSVATMGGNVREVGARNSPDRIAPANATGNSGNYNYRY
ncbi:MAG: glycine zipper 2TM domain-containing protein [Burkholderiales bacterium]|nr:glycine zipper 2TM domain-containing protein [Burkholderiales bacterium]